MTLNRYPPEVADWAPIRTGPPERRPPARRVCRIPTELAGRPSTDSGQYFVCLNPDSALFHSGKWLFHSNRATTLAVAKVLGRVQRRFPPKRPRTGQSELS